MQPPSHLTFVLFVIEKLIWVFDGNIKTNLKQVATRAGRSLPGASDQLRPPLFQYSYLALQPL